MALVHETRDAVTQSVGSRHKAWAVVLIKRARRQNCTLFLHWWWKPLGGQLFILLDISFSFAAIKVGRQALKWHNWCGLTSELYTKAKQPPNIIHQCFSVKASFRIVHNLRSHQSEGSLTPGSVSERNFLCIPLCIAFFNGLPYFHELHTKKGASVHQNAFLAGVNACTFARWMGVQLGLKTVHFCSVLKKRVILHALPHLE